MRLLKLILGVRGRIEMGGRHRKHKALPGPEYWQGWCLVCGLPVEGHQ